MRAVLVIAMLVSRIAAAEHPQLADARAQYDAGEQERALAILASLLSTPMLDEHERASALRLAGCAEMVIGHQEAAIARFKEAFALEPDEPLEPRLETVDTRSLYERARGEWRTAQVAEMDNRAVDREQIKLTVDAPTHAVGGEPLRVGVSLVDPGRLVARVDLEYRRRGAGTYTLMIQRTPLLAFTIPAEATESERGFVLEYHVTLRAQTGFDLVRDRDANHPHAIAVAPGHVPRWHEHWWVRGLLGTAVVALGAGGYLAYRSIDAGPQHIRVVQ